MKPMRPIFLLCCLLSVIFFAVDSSLPEGEGNHEERIKELEEQMAKLIASNEEKDETIKELKAEIERLKKEAAVDREPDHIMNFLQNIPFLGDGVKFVADLVFPSEFCDNDR